MRGRKRVNWVLFLALAVSLLLPAQVKADVVDAKAEAYVLMDADSGKVLLAKNEHKKLAPASMT